MDRHLDLNDEEYKKMNYEMIFIENLADIIEKKGISEIAIENGNKSITIKGNTFVKQIVNEQIENKVNVEEEKVRTVEDSLKIVKAPIVGTYYSASSPDAPSFVSEGQKVNKGDVIMIIESMKLMNEVQSEYDGVVKEILVKNGDYVEYDQPLMLIS